MVVGPMVMLIGLAAAITAVVLSLTLSTAWFLALLLPAVLALAAGGFIIWISRRSRLEIRPDGVTWCGPLGAESSLAWTQVQQILPAPPGSPRTAAIAQLTDGSRVPIEARWIPATAPSNVLGGADHSEALKALADGHRTFLARRG